MIGVKETKEAQEARAAAPFRVNVPIESTDPMEKVLGNRDYGRLSETMFRDPAEMVTISADRFERLIRSTERVNQQLGEYEQKIGRAFEFIDVVAREWAEKGSPIPRYEDMSRMAEILGWKESYEIHDIRVTQRMIRDQAKKEKEAANNGEAAD